MSFKKYLEEINNLTGFSKEQKLVLLIGKEFEEMNFKLKPQDDIFSNFRNQEGKFVYDFIKNNNNYNLIIQNNKDGKYEITLSNGKRKTVEEIKIDNYLIDNDSSKLTKYIKERINNIEDDPLLIKNIEYIRENESPYINNNINNNLNNVFEENYNVQRNFQNLGYNDLHGDLPNFIPGYNNNFGRPNGNLMGRDNFNFGGGFGGIRYDPITPFGPKFDFIPQYDGPMKKANDPNFNLGIPKWEGGNGFNNFGGGGFNPFI